MFESTPNRRRIIASYWLVVILALPLWWKTTSIDRLSLPENRVHGLTEKQVKDISMLMVRNVDGVPHSSRFLCAWGFSQVHRGIRAY